MMKKHLDKSASMNESLDLDNILKTLLRWERNAARASLTRPDMAWIHRAISKTADATIALIRSF